MGNEAQVQDRTVELVRERETKNTVRFAEIEVDGQPPIIGTLYVQKWVIGQVGRIRVTIQPLDDEDPG
jgi:hypothetical protein